MENKTKILSIICIAFLLLCQCKKEAEPQLPPITTTGANTFGCKVNGRVFVPRDGNGKPGLYAQYANFNIGPGATGGWYLNIPAIDYQKSQQDGVNIGTDSLLVTEGKTYKFKYRTKGFPTAFYANIDEFNAYETEIGELTILKFDPIKRVLSGTFYFTGIGLNFGEKVNVTDGRFDILY